MVLGHPDLDRDGPALAALLLVRRRADVGGAPGGGARADRADGAALRAVRGADDGLDDVARPAPHAGRLRRAASRLASAGRPVAAGDGRDHVGRRRAAARRRARRDRRARLAGDGRLLQEPRGHRGGLGARLAPHRRHRLPRRRRLPVHRRPGEGHGHHRRVQRVLRRGRAGPHGARGRPRLRGDRAAGREVGRAGDRGGRARSRSARCPATTSSRSSRRGSAA